VIGEILRCPSPSALHESAAALFASLAADAIATRGAFSVALSGGTTPKAVYSRLADEEAVGALVQWQRVIFFWGDERHVPPDHRDSNFRMARKSMLSRLPVDPGKVWRIKGEYADAAQAAAEYERDLRQVFGADALPRFDLVLLGLGADGHTASLYPGTEALYEERRLAVANWVPALNAHRITLTPPVLNNAADVLVLVQGRDKADALEAVINGPYEPERLPAQLIRPVSGRLRWLVDPSAARRLSR
jgi:6-phosphogluconolactonase